MYVTKTTQKKTIIVSNNNYYLKQKLNPFKMCKMRSDLNLVYKIM